MARIGGRSTWIAVPAGLACAGVVGALVWLALPMGPAVVQWTGDTLRSATEQLRATDQAGSGAAPVIGAADCRELYPDALWAELTLRADARLSQDASPPATAATSVVDAIAPAVRMTCAWRSDAGEISTTLATIDEADAGLVESALLAQGFACAEAADVVSCARTQGLVREEHAIAGEVWLSSVESGWQPEGYGEQLIAHVWG